MPGSETALAAGDVVVVPFPYVDRLAEKRRPALVVSTPLLARSGFLWLAMITSRRNAPGRHDVEISDLALAGLPTPSVVRPVKIACVEPSRVVRRAGRLDPATALAVFARLRAFLASPEPA